GTDVAAGTTVGSYTLDEAISMGSTALDASLGSMQAGGNFYPSAYTLSFWVDISALPSSGNITLFTYGGTSPAGNDGSNALALNSDGTLTFGQGKTSGTSFEFRTDRQVTTTGNALTTNTVYHIALVNNGKDGDANTATLYINGTAVLNNVAVNLNMGGGTKSTVFSNLNLASASNISYGDAYLYNSALDASDVQKFTENYTITWNGGADGTWNSTATNWTHEGADVAFDNSGYDNVKFTSDAAVTVDEAVTVRNLYVTGGNVSFSGSSSILSTNGVTVSGSGVLSIDKYGDGSKSIIHGKLLIENGGKVKLTDGDATGYNGGSNAINTLVINEGGELIIETNSYAGTNQTFNMSGGITLQGGKISGTNADGYSKFDLFNSNTGITTLASSTTAEIQASIGLRLNGTFDVAAGTTADGVDLLVSGCLTSKAKFGNTSNNESFSTTLRKIGAGTMKLTGDNQYWTTGGTVEAGKLVAASANALGTGAITVNGDGSILDFSVAGGTFEQGSNQALTTTNGGKITVSAGTLALTGAVNLSNAIEVADGATVTTTRDVKFALGGLTGTAGESGTTFRLFTLAEGSSLTWAEGLGGANVNTSGTSVIGRGAGATFNANGTVTVSDGTAGDLIWVGDSAGAGTWNYATDNKPWTSGDVATSFMNKDNVTFAKNAAVTVDAAGICVGKMTIASGNTVTLTGGNLTVSDSIELGTGAMLSLGAGSANGATATLADNSVYAITASASGAVALDNVSGTGTLKFAGVGNLTDSGGSDPAFSTVAIGSGFTGTVEITAGLVDMLENADGASAILPSRLGSASKVVLNGGGLLFRNVNNTTQSDKGTFTTAIEVGAAGGVIRLYGNGNVTLASDISGAGTLKHTDGGTLTLAGTVNMTGGFSQVAGTTNFNDAATLGTLKVTGGTTTFAGATNITSATVTGGTLKFDFGALNDANTFSSASTLAVNGGTAIFGYGSGGGATITGDSFGQNLSIVVGSGARMTIAIAKNSMKAFAGNLTLKNGATYYKFDGGVELTGNVTLGEADSDLVYLLGNWGKLGTKISGSLSGAGTAYFGNEAYSDTTTEVLTISGSNNSYSGEIVVGRKNADTYSARNTELVLSTATALQNGKVNLAGSAAGNYAQLTLGANAITIAGLSGTEFGKVALGSGVSSSTLTLNQASDTT
ncbi:MAG: beta strand repeat-containing protein, partial [Candidatus Spyradosoma sp.]